MNLLTIVNQLKQERNRLDNAIRALEGSGNHSGRSTTRTLSVAARARIAAAQRARWAKVRGNAAPATKVVAMRKKRKLSAAALKRIREAQKKRWAAWRKKNKS